MNYAVEWNSIQAIRRGRYSNIAVMPNCRKLRNYYIYQYHSSSYRRFQAGHSRVQALNHRRDAVPPLRA
jgi:hypothetical protein